MTKKQLIEFINKYSLGGINETVKLVSQNNTLMVKFVAPTKDLVGEIIMNESPVPDSELCIYNTSQLLKLLSITDGELLFDLEGGKNPKRANISDTVYHLSYTLADPILVGAVPNVKDADFEYSFLLNEENKQKIIKAKNAMGDNDLVWVGVYDDISNTKIQLVFGENSNHSNKVSLFIDPVGEAVKSPLIPFPSSIIKEILNANKTENGECFVNKDGLMKLHFTGEKITSTYFLIRKNIE